MYLIRRCLNESFVTCQCATQNLASRYTNAFGHLLLSTLHTHFIFTAVTADVHILEIAAPKNIQIQILKHQLQLSTVHTAAMSYTHLVILQE